MRQHPEWRSIPIVVLTAKDLTPEELRSLDGSLLSVIHKGGRSREELMLEVRDLIADWAVPARRTGSPEAAARDKTQR